MQGKPLAYCHTSYEPNPKGVPSDRQLNLLASVACESAGTLAALFIDDDTPLPLRGCISFGCHLCEGNFLIGPAVDEAAEYMKEPEGGFIWVLPLAEERHKRFLDRSLAMVQGLPDETLKAALKLAAERGATDASKLIEHPASGTDKYTEALRQVFAQMLAAPTVIEGYPMPIKRGASIDAAVVNPLLGAKTGEERRKLIGRYEQFLQGNRIDIWMKRQNTLKFLAIADQAAAKFRSALESGNYP
jgi:hypothetical protein